MFECEICNEQTVELIWSEPGWRRCRFCGCDTNYGARRNGEYTIEYAKQALAQDGVEGLKKQLTENIKLIERFRRNSKTALDVGCNEGTLRDMLNTMGLDAIGFDIYDGVADVVAPEYRAIYGKFDIVVCREVIEHVINPEFLLSQLIESINPGGTLHLQTPRPIERYAGEVYQTYHNHILHPMVVGGWLSSYRDCQVLHRQLWDKGQLWVVSRR